ncbi:MAG: hypothetical protein K5839_04055 [Treponemataceae bacterium]|nr:hypothetical protein [Treponemataceae bacterium]
MQLYDDVINDWNKLFQEYSSSTKELKIGSQWPDVGKHNMILRSDMAYELGGSEKPLPAIGGTALTSNEEFVPQDQILLIGPDLTEITEDLPFARISCCRVDSESMGEGNILYKAVKNIDYCRYHVSPEGFMMRVSSLQNRESVRVSKTAIKNKISFSDAGSLMINSYHKDPKVIAAKVVYITLKDFNFAELEKLVKQTDMITKTIDHIMSSALMDCGTCGLQKICDEVEGMRELHFKHNAENS